MHINQFIAHAGICSRRKADDLIRKGKIFVNGESLNDVTYRVQNDDVIVYNKEVLTIERKHYILLHKPMRYLTTVRDEQGRPTVMTLLNMKNKIRIYPVGRLDYMTTGLLILTNDGPLAHKLAHPSSGVQKKYHVTLDRPLSTIYTKKIIHGVVLDDGPVHVDSFKILNKKKDQVEIILHIGRNRIIRRLFTKLGYQVTQLKRIGYANLTLENLSEGKSRPLTLSEIEALQKNTTNSST